ncbi:hypothetical protein ACLOJK_029606 [Asimina triloba]
MAATAPVAIGTRGTIGSLVLQEIEYFRRLELDCCETTHKLEAQTTTRGPACCGTRIKFGSAVMIAVKKRKTKNKRKRDFLPSLCSTIEVVDDQATRVQRFSYRNLKTDEKNEQG